MQELCNNIVGSRTTTNGVVTEYVNYFKEELDLDSVESVVVNGDKEYRETSEAYKKAQKLGATILYEPSYIQDSPYKYICFGMLDLDGNMIEVANYEEQRKI